MAGDGNFHAHGLRGGMPAGDIHGDVAQRLARHLLGGVDGGEDRGFRRFHVDDGAAAQAPGELVADARRRAAGRPRRAGR